MLFGNKTTFAIECENFHYMGSMFFGQLRIWLQGQAIGDFTEEVLGLASTTGMLKDSLALLNQPVPAELTKMSHKDLLTEIWSVRYGDVYHEAKFKQYGPFIWFEQCEGFISQRSIRIPVQNGQKIIWQHVKGPATHSTVIPNDVYTSVITDFLNWLDKKCHPIAHTEPNHVIEQRWVDYWNDVYDLAQECKHPPVYLLPDYQVVSLDDFQGWIQEQVYDGKRLQFETLFFQGQPAIRAVEHSART